MTLNNRRMMYSKISKILRSRNENTDNLLLSNTFISISSNSKNNNKKNNQNNNSTIKNKEKYLTHNKSSKNKVIIKRNKNHKENNKKNQKNFLEKAMKTFEDSGKKSNNFIGQKNNMLNTNYIINKRCRIINNKNKKNMSINLSRYFLDYSQKKTKSPKNNLEINVSNNNIDNLRDTHININHKVIHNKNNNIQENNKLKRNKNSIQLNPYTLYNFQNQSIVRKYNTNIKSTRILNSISSNSKKRKKIIS